MLHTSGRTEKDTHIIGGALNNKKLQTECAIIKSEVQLNLCLLKH